MDRAVDGSRRRASLAIERGPDAQAVVVACERMTERRAGGRSRREQDTGLAPNATLVLEHGHDPGIRSTQIVARHADREPAPEHRHFGTRVVQAFRQGRGQLLPFDQGVSQALEHVHRSGLGPVVVVRGCSHRKPTLVTSQ